MEGWNGGRRFPWSYTREAVGSNVSSSRSGTIVSGLSTSYTPSRGSRFSTFSMEAEAMRFDSLGIHEEEHDGKKLDDWEEAEDEDEHIRRVVQEFFSECEPTPSSAANCSIKGGGNMGVLERWLTKLGVSWVLSPGLDDGSSAEEQLGRDARTWILALHKITQAFYSWRPLFPDRGSSVVLPSICDEGEPVVVAKTKSLPDLYHFALFIQETMLKVLPFVDVLVALDPNTIEKFLSMGEDELLPYTHNLSYLLDAHGALSQVSNNILTLFDSPTSVDVQRIENEMDILLSAYKNKLGEAIWSTMEKITTKILEEDGNDSSSSLNEQGQSSDIHKVTQSLLMYTRFLQVNYSSLDAAIHGKDDVRSLESMVMKMVSCLEEKLASISESFADQGLRFLFLLNNSHFIIEQLLPHSYFYFYHFTGKTEEYMERYLQVSWAPLLSCLLEPTPLCLGKNYSPLSKFESEFQKTYTTQIQWKVPNPWFRRRLREVIIDKIIPDYTEFLEDNKVINPKISPQELEAMLQELFEG